MKFRFPRIYPSTNVELSGLSHAEQVRRLAAGGATVIQLREKQSPGAEFCTVAREALAVARDLGVKLIINDRVDIALAVNSDGVHLGQDDLPIEAARNLLGSAAIIGISTHNVTQAAAAKNLPVDYVAIGPVFSTRTKTDTDPVLGLQGVSEVKQVVGNLPLVAIGGITQANAAEVIRSGADAVALISDLVSVPNEISSRTESLLKSLNSID